MEDVADNIRFVVTKCIQLQLEPLKQCNLTVSGLKKNKNKLGLLSMNTNSFPVLIVWQRVVPEVFYD